MSYLNVYLLGVLVIFVYGLIVVIFTAVTTKDNDATWKHYVVVLCVFPMLSWLAVTILLFI